SAAVMAIDPLCREPLRQHSPTSPGRKVVLRWARAVWVRAAASDSLREKFDDVCQKTIARHESSAMLRDERRFLLPLSPVRPSERLQGFCRAIESFVLGTLGPLHSLNGICAGEKVICQDQGGENECVTRRPSVLP